MKKRKQIAGMIASFLLLMVLLPLNVCASGKIIVEVSSKTAAVGDTVKITARAADDGGSQVKADLTFQYDSSKFEFVSCSEAAYGGGAGGTVTTSASSATITLKAITTGNTKVIASGTNATQGELIAAGAKLDLTGGEVKAPAEPASSNPPQENTDTQPASQGTEESITMNGAAFRLAKKIPDNVIPENFTKCTVTCQGQEVEGLTFQDGILTLVYLTTPDAAVKNTLAVYEQTSGNIMPFQKVVSGTGYVIVINPPVEDQPLGAETQTMVSIGEITNVTAYQMSQEGMTDFYFIYGINNNGAAGWYRYDGIEGTLQRYIAETASNDKAEVTADVSMKSLQKAYDKLDKEYTREKDVSRKTMAVMIFIMAVFVIVIINLLIRGKGSKVNIEYEDELKEVPRKRNKRRPISQNRRRQVENLELEENPKLEESFEAEENIGLKENLELEETIELGENFKTEENLSKEKDFKPEKNDKLGKSKHISEKKVQNDKLNQPLQMEEDDGFEVIDLDDL
ncbi:MAG: hypothetical protein RSD28_00875 [Lachnospiraceae bacterium]